MKTQIGNTIKKMLSNYGIEYSTNGATYSNTSLMLNQYIKCDDGMILEHYEGVIYSIEDDYVEMNFGDWNTDNKIINDVKHFLAEHDLQLIFGKDDVRLNDRKTGITVDKEIVRWCDDCDIEKFVSDDDHETYIFNYKFD